MFEIIPETQIRQKKYEREDGKLGKKGVKQKPHDGRTLKHNGSQDVHNTNISTKACTGRLVALSLVPYLLETVKQDGGLALMLLLIAACFRLT